ncbi:hypothetical protein [Arthrobacter sp. JUb115]|uniref:hypothetical protein n=1 Tax=Arthrobacter sp. JUb115 TaxID=2485108 RepID=UPI0010612CFE|nr:hypothetical protein [Arthrobacter sp. JUb115]TDU20255.1 hypothetical protein EDF61_1131 [Arthrobacter sp. JUb115]
MHVRVSPGSVALDEPDDCTTFKVLLPEEIKDDLQELLESAAAGKLDASDVLVSVDWIKSECAGRIGIGWNYRFANMLVYAAGKGWLTPDGSHVRAHVETF